MPEFASYMALLITVVMALASLVLLIACANVATLLVGRENAEGQAVDQDRASRGQSAEPTPGLRQLSG